MRTVFLLFDSLNRHALGCYGGTEVPTPNIDRLAERGVRFTNHWAGSLPCMPARREIHTGRLNFLHRSWGPLEPFDDSFARTLDQAGIYTHLATDHYHYWEEGGAGYHNQYSSFEFHRGQEKDKWKGLVDLPVERWRETHHPSRVADTRDAELTVVNLINREYIQDEEDFSIVGTIADGIEFLDTNKNSDNWMLNIECFDPHEPFIAPDRYKEPFRTDYQGPIRDWPTYRPADETPEEIAELRANYAALLSMCDHYIGKLLDYFDEHDLWKDTAIVLTTDHGFLLSEHDWWGKMRMPFYNEISHIPLITYHPDHADKAGETRDNLTHSTDIMPTLLDIHGVDIPKDVKGHSLLPMMAEDNSIRDACIYGLFGASVNITDGRYTYFLYPPDINDQELYEYTLMPTHMRTYFAVDEFEGMTLTRPFDFTKNTSTLKIQARMGSDRGPLKGATIEDTNTVLYDLKNDPGQKTPIDDPETVARLTNHMIQIMAEHDAPGEAYRRLGLKAPSTLSHP